MAFSVDLESLFDVEWEWALSHCTTIQLTEIRQFEVDTPDFFSFNGMGLLLALFWHNNTGHVSLEPETTSPGVRIVIGCILSAFLAWDVVHTLLRHAHISWLQAGGCGRWSDPSWSSFDADHNAAHRFDPIPIVWPPVTHSKSGQMALYMQQKIHREKLTSGKRKWRHWIRHHFSFPVAFWIL